MFEHLCPNCCHLGKCLNVIYREGSLPPPTGRPAQQHRLLGGAWGCLGALDQPLYVLDLCRLEGVLGIIRIILSNERACQNQRHQPVMPAPFGVVGSPNRRISELPSVAYQRLVKAPYMSLGLTLKVVKCAPMIKDPKKYVPRI